MVKAETEWFGTRKTSEWFYTAGRTIKTGLIASSIVSAWTWAATLLQSSTVTYEFGLGGAFWYAAGAITEGFAVGEALSEWIGWVIVVGLGMVFAVIITIEVKIKVKYLGVSQTSEMFNTAGRTIKTGLTAAAIVPAWTWPLHCFSYLLLLINMGSVIHFGMQQEHQFRFYYLGFYLL
ncbi:MAG: hypothetical protein OEL56_05810 [Nitrosopumilus sp.]|nr:hypothetical protein [Nitrosopumilus sp.]MDH3516019.1 hypothetical protein [Nitrosopumilus sp.]MDH3565650.1 hypothetical protein [Nitrosopumilus sp.]MDH5417280.1 hypothetical protein [Nitrosopumilus sp.]MDH5555562.1 hypothetical protein [Nitrosopumilus sp.]